MTSQERFACTGQPAASAASSSCHEDDEEDPDDLPPVTKCPENGSQNRRWEDWLDVRDLPLVTKCPAMASARYRPSDWLDPRESDEEEEDGLPMTKRPEDGANRLHHFEPQDVTPPVEVGPIQSPKRGPVREAQSTDRPAVTPQSTTTAEETSPNRCHDDYVSHADVTCELTFT